MEPTVTNLDAARPFVDQPHALYFVGAAFVCLVVTQLPLVIRRGDRFARRCYWGGTAGAVTCGFIAGIPDWVGSLVFACGAIMAMVITAYFATNYIRIGGKVYTFHIMRPVGKSSQELPEDYSDAYGTDVTAKKMWWLMVPATGLCVFGVATHLKDSDGLVWLVVSLAVIAVLATGFGYISDGSWGHPVARRQYLQFVLVSVITAGLFALFYLPAYFVGRRWPWRTSKSLERQARPQ